MEATGVRDVSGVFRGDGCGGGECVRYHTSKCEHAFDAPGRSTMAMEWWLSYSARSALGIYDHIRWLTLAAQVAGLLDWLTNCHYSCVF